MVEASSDIEKDELRDLSRDDEPTLLRRARTGDSDAFARIVRIHQTAALRLATVITGDSTEAYDVVQDAFVKAHAGLGTVRDDLALRPWLMRIVANQAKNAQRSRWRRNARHDRHVALRHEHPAEADELALGAVEAAALLAAVAKLSATDRSIIGCRFFAGLDEAETASALAIARGTVKSRTSRALARLRVILGDEDTCDGGQTGKTVTA